MRYNPFDGYSYHLTRSIQVIDAHLRVLQAPHCSLPAPVRKALSFCVVERTTNAFSNIASLPMLTMLYTMVAYFYSIPELITTLLSTIGQEML